MGRTQATRMPGDYHESIGRELLVLSVRKVRMNILGYAIRIIMCGRVYSSY